MILYHGTSVPQAQMIVREGFKQAVTNFPDIPSKEGFAYFSDTYAPYYAMLNRRSKKYGAIVKVEVDIEDLYPDEDFIVQALIQNGQVPEGIRPIDLALSICIEDYKNLAQESIKFLGTAAAKFEDVKILGMKKFPLKDFAFVCDPSVTLTGYRFCAPYYMAMTEEIWETGDWRNMQYASVADYFMRSRSEAINNG